jgi:hypothetical protein
MLPLIWISSALVGLNAWFNGDFLAGVVVMAVGYALGKALQVREGEDRLARKIRGD